MSWRDDIAEVPCSHCHGRGFHGTGAVWDEDTHRAYPTDCGCCSGRGYHPVHPDRADRPYPCFTR
jgi:hypothetical protein